MIEYKEPSLTIYEVSTDIVTASLGDLEAGFSDGNTLPLWKAD